ncbi:MAG: stage III sporulation protein AE [Christensenellales bacterium]
MKSQKKKAVYILIAMLWFFATGSALAAPADETQIPAQQAQDEINQTIDNQIEELDLDKLNTLLYDLPDSAKEILGFKTAGEMIEQIAKGDMALDMQGIFAFISRLLLKEVTVFWPILLKAVVLALLCTILVALRSGFKENRVSEVSYLVCYMLIVILLSQSVFYMIRIVNDTITSMVSLMQAVFPILLVMMTTLGGSVSAGVFQPAMSFLAGGMAAFFKDVMLPAMSVAAVLAIISNISERIQIKRLFELVKSASQWVIGIAFTVYLGIISVQGMAASAIDGISIRTAKFTIDKLVPVAGKMLAETVDTVLGCSLVVKNACGIFSLLLCVMVLLLPAVKVMVSVFMLRISAAVLEPVSDSRLVHCMEDLSKVLVLILVCLIAVGLMMFITIALVLSAGNTNIMMR